MSDIAIPNLATQARQLVEKTRRERENKEALNFSDARCFVTEKIMEAAKREATGIDIYCNEGELGNLNKDAIAKMINYLKQQGFEVCLANNRERFSSSFEEGYFLGINW